MSEELRKAESRFQTATRDGDKAKEMFVSLTKESETLKSQLQDVYRLDSEKSTQMATMEARVRVSIQPGYHRPYYKYSIRTLGRLV